MKSQIQRLNAAISRSLLPPPKMTVSEWADERRFLSSESSSQVGKWRTATAEYQRGMMDVFSEPDVREIYMMTSAQTGKTEVMNNVIGYHMEYDPAPMLVLQPTLEMSRAWSTDRLSPMIRDTPTLNKLFKDKRTRDSGNMVLHKSFIGGHITMAGANSPASLASRPIRINLNDEVDRMPRDAGGEGDPLSLAKKRTITFHNAVFANWSTPTIKGESRIEEGWEKSDKRRFFVPCCECGEHQTLNWEFVKWEKDDFEPYYLCCHCGSTLDDGDLLRMVRLGEWRATEPFKGIAGFHINELYSPFVSLKETVLTFLEAKSKPELLQVFINTALGEPWEDKGETVEHSDLMTRRENYLPDLLPDGIVMITAGVDVQADRLELEVVGWGAGEESWGIEYHILRGDPLLDDVWQELDDILKKRYVTGDGRTMPIEAACVDSGYLPDVVYRFTAPRKRRCVWAIKGADGAGRPVFPKRNSTVRNKNVLLFVLGVDTAKEIIYSRLKGVTEHGAGYMHFPLDYDEEFFRQLTAEAVRKKYKKGRSYREWYKKRKRNEALDTRIYAYAAYLGRGVNLDKRALKMKDVDKGKKEVGKRRQTRRGGGFVKNW